jgi:hypothetical protein
LTVRNLPLLLILQSHIIPPSPFSPCFTPSTTASLKGVK